MKFSTITAATVVVGLGLTLSACSDDSDNGEATSSSAATSSATQASVEPPTAEELNAVLQRATDPNVPLEEKTQTVQGGETAPELFDVMTASQQDSGAKFTVVDPILPGYTPEYVIAKVVFSVPDQEDQVAEDVEFVHEDGVWKLSQSWACMLVSNTVEPEQVPAMCQGDAPAEDPAEGAPEGAPAEEAPEGAPAEAPVEEAPAQ
ncbi:hypothetical protein QQA02_07890 [Corynebacterium sp. MSK006]|uniref:hypothetical protein n=1 Tax=Corynebacterium sp. MSK006 TaxID=3050187 RepID=UPI00254F92B9|nr:hypothetical protein [Corynebacterium sp. MSK006]MDK8895602.1 hypothetical protein [Corynebacterium sp. MSK006]